MSKIYMKLDYGKGSSRNRCHSLLSRKPEKSLVEDILIRRYENVYRKRKKYIENSGLKLDFNHLSDNDYFLIEEVLSDKLEIFGFDRNYEPTDNGIICLTILDKLA